MNILSNKEVGLLYDEVIQKIYKDMKMGLIGRRKKLIGEDIKKARLSLYIYKLYDKEVQQFTPIPTLNPKPCKRTDK